MGLIYSPEKDSYLLEKTLFKKIPILLENKSSLRFLEIGVGSGIQLKVAKSTGIKMENIFGVDINLDAVAYCKKLGFNCMKSNLFENIKGKYDLIIFNPPYLPEDESPEDEESKLITTGGKNGSEIINEFLKQAKNYLNKNGRIYLLVSSLTRKINWNGFKKKLLIKEKMFFEELKIYELTL